MSGTGFVFGTAKRTTAACAARGRSPSTNSTFPCDIAYALDSARRSAALARAVGHGELIGGLNTTLGAEVNIDGNFWISDFDHQSSYKVQFARSHVAANGKSFKLVVVYPLAPTVTLQPSSVSVVEGESASFTAAASGSPVPTVQWEESTDGGGTWTPISGATSDELKVSGTTVSESGSEYRAAFHNEAQNQSVKSSAAALTVNP